MNIIDSSSNFIDADSINYELENIKLSTILKNVSERMTIIHFGENDKIDSYVEKDPSNLAAKIIGKIAKLLIDSPQKKFIWTIELRTSTKEIEDKFVKARESILKRIKSTFAYYNLKGDQEAANETDQSACYTFVITPDKNKMNI